MPVTSLSDPKDAMKTRNAEHATMIRLATKDPFVRVPKSMLDDEALSWKAKGMLCYLLGKPEGWQPQIGDITRKATDGGAAVRSGLDELRESGYAQLQKIYGPTGVVEKWLMVVADCPCFPPSITVVSIRPPKQKKEAQPVQSQQPNPDGDFPDLENLDLENRDLSKNEPNQERKEPRTKSIPTGEAATKPERKDRAESLQVVIDFCLSLGLQRSDGDFFWNKWEANGWQCGGKRVKDWKAQIRSWKAAGYCPSQKERVNGNGYHRGAPDKDPLFERALAEVKYLGRV